ncbi:MAG TPA: acetolactate synthase small subunit [Candidatus Stercoripulliclostridium merdipullorum]|uniref:Acetolactate synthase small subunit n=1 Tax=Candidatus Stercoripulliclostridium merdipullorum TaxID=2840952 RepID=A0A9D1NBC8_9FIRM|nr:acetolactate synthase small subunit [Candidatus Stercoripulliclostridium merdipullorum]
MDKHYLSILVENRAGVLSRISGLIARRGFNIDSLTVCATENDDYSRMTIALTADERTLTQIKNQLSKQVEVVRIIELTAEDSVLRELLIVKIRSNAKLIPEITDITTIFKAKTIDISDASMTLELTGRGAKLDSFLRLLAPYGILEMARSGASALQRGEECLGEQK